MAEYAIETMNMERLLFELFQQVGGELKGRFVSVVRTIAPVLAGGGKMPTVAASAPATPPTL